MGDSRDNVLLSLGAALLGLVGEAAPSGLMVRNAEALTPRQLVRRRGDDQEQEAPLLLVAQQPEGPILVAGHSSHRSHSSHYSGGGGGRSWSPSYDPSPGYVPQTEPAPAPAPPPKPKPAVVSFVVIPGGQIFIDGTDVGHDTTKHLKLAAGTHTVRIENRFLGSRSTTVTLTEGQTGVISIKW